MSGIKGRDTKIELVIRRALHSRGLRYRLHTRALPGRPDMAFAGRRAVVLVNGCFWHGHDCPLFRLPGSNGAFWRAKIDANRARDERTLASLQHLGWRTSVVWECALRGQPQSAVTGVADRLEQWLKNGTGNLDLRGGGTPVRPSASRATTDVAQTVAL